MNEVYILGGGRTDFKRNLKKEGKTIRHLIIEAGKKAIDDAKIDPGEIQAGTVGNFNAGQFTKQLQLGAFIPEIDPKLRGIPTMHTEAACASGALSVLLGAQWIMGGFYDVVLVVGAEQQKTMSSLDGSDVLGAAADYHNEKPEYGDFMFPKLFGRIAQIYIDKYGATEQDLATVAWKNYAHAKLNPLAQMRDADLTLDCASQVSDKNPSVAPPLFSRPTAPDWCTCPDRNCSHAGLIRPLLPNCREQNVRRRLSSLPTGNGLPSSQTTGSRRSPCKAVG